MTGAPGARALALALAAALSSGACGGGGARDGATADTAVLAGTRPPPVATDSLDIAPPPLLDDSLVVRSSTGGAGPRAVLRADSVAGDRLYRGAGCQGCHGARGEGVAGLGPALADSLWLHGDGSPAFVQGVILAGIAEPRELRRAMPAYASRLSPAEAARIAAYVVALARPELVVDELPPSGAGGVDTLPPP